MIRTLTFIALAATAMICNSCCCTSDIEAPGLEPLPKFREFPSAPEVSYEK